MAKEVSKVVKLQARGGQANPSPPIGPALGAAGVNIMEFCKQFNARNAGQTRKSNSCSYHRGTKISHSTLLSKQRLLPFSYWKPLRLKEVPESQTVKK